MQVERRASFLHRGVFSPLGWVIAKRETWLSGLTKFSAERECPGNAGLASQLTIKEGTVPNNSFHNDHCEGRNHDPPPPPTHIHTGVCARSVMWVKVRVCRCGHGANFFVVYTLPAYVRMWLSARLSWRLFWNVQHLGGHFGVFDSQCIFPLTALLYSLYWPWDPLSSLESTPVSI